MADRTQTGTFTGDGRGHVASLRRRRRRDHRGRRLDGGLTGVRPTDRVTADAASRGRSRRGTAIWNQGKDAHSGRHDVVEMGLDIDARPAAWPQPAARGCDLNVRQRRRGYRPPSRGSHRQPVLSVNAGSADIPPPARCSTARPASTPGRSACVFRRGRRLASRRAQRCASTSDPASRARARLDECLTAPAAGRSCVSVNLDLQRSALEGQ